LREIDADLLQKFAVAATGLHVSGTHVKKENLQQPHSSLASINSDFLHILVEPQSRANNFFKKSLSVFNLKIMTLFNNTNNFSFCP
jgi:hypothetical protein